MELGKLRFRIIWIRRLCRNFIQENSETWRMAMVSDKPFPFGQRKTLSENCNLEFLLCRKAQEKNNRPILSGDNQHEIGWNTSLKRKTTKFNKSRNSISIQESISIFSEKLSKTLFDCTFDDVLSSIKSVQEETLAASSSSSISID